MAAPDGADAAEDAGAAEKGVGVAAEVAAAAAAKEAVEEAAAGAVEEEAAEDMGIAEAVCNECETIEEGRGTALTILEAGVVGTAGALMEFGLCFFFV